MTNDLDKFICGHCSEEISNDGDSCICRLCSNRYHFGECSMKRESWRGLGKNRQKTWTCDSCRSKPITPSQGDHEASAIDINAKLDKLLEMQVTVEEIKKSMEFLSQKYDEMVNQLAETREENKALVKEVNRMKKKEAQTEELVKSLTERVNELDMYGRRVNLEIFGVQVKSPRIAEEDTAEVVKGLAQEIGVPYREEDVHKLHRLQARSDGRPPIILVQFFSTVTRDRWLEAGKKARLQDKAGNKIYFNENLTVYYRSLLKEAKKRASMHNYKFVWVKSGKIFVRKHEGDKNVLVIKSFDDLNKII